MKKAALFSLPVALGLLLYPVFHSRFSPAEPKPYYPVECTGEGLTIGIIGDSWVSKGKLEAPLKEALESKGIKADVISWGHGGFKSKQIYNSLFDEARFVIESCPDYVIVIAGVNDSLSMLGEGYYVSNLQEIVAFLKHYGITPVVLELPAFDLIEGQDAANPLGRLRTLGMAWINGTYDRDNIDGYRKALEGKLDAIVVDFDSVATAYTPDLYKDFTHLNGKGNRKMMDEVVNTLFPKFGKQRKK